VAVLVAIIFIVLVGFIAYAVDINHLYVVRNELQNAADAGALAGALALYEDPDGLGPLAAGEEVNALANSIAKAIGTANNSDQLSVEIDWTGGNVGDVQRGHWSFANDKFTALDTLDPMDIWGVPDADLDLMDGTYEYPAGSGLYPQFVNAVQVITRRDKKEAASFFAPIYGYFGFKLQAKAVAYLGFSGSLGPFEVDMPIVICDNSLTHGDCNIGRMINSGSKTETFNTAAWAEMDPYTQAQVDAGECNSGTNSNAVKGLVEDGCAGNGINPQTIEGGNWLDANNGDIAAAFNKMKTCWEADTGGQSPWEMTLPVVECGPNGVANCVKVLGAVTVNMLLMTPPSVDPETTTPTIMNDPENPEFPAWNASADCAYFNDLAKGVYNGVILPDNFQSTVLPLLPGEDYANGVDPWLIEDRWNGVASSGKVYTAGMGRWDCFANHFNLRNNDGTMAPLAFHSMYFMPNCEYHEPKGTTGGTNFGVMAKYPVLVD
jgi:hypothetical protein